MKKRIDGRNPDTVRLVGLALASILFLSAVIVLVGNQFVVRIRAKVRSTTVQVISELTDTKARVVTGLLQEGQTDVRTLAAFLGKTADGAERAALLREFQQNRGAEEAAVLDDQGGYLFGSESILPLGGLPEGLEAAVAREGTAMSDVVVCEMGKRRILVGAAIPGGGQVYAGLSVDALQRAYGESTYRGEGYSYVVERDGDIMIPPIRYSYEQVYGNIRTLLRESGNDAGDLDAFMEALAGGSTGSVVFFFDGQEQLLCFQPLGTDKEWQFVTVVPLAAVEQDGAEIIQSAVFMACILVAAIALSLAVGLAFYATTQRRRRENDRFLRSMYQAISENTDTVIFILDDDSSRLDYVFENSGRLLGIQAEEFLSGPDQTGKGGAFRESLSALLRTQRPPQGCEHEMHTYNDRLQRDMWLKVLICPFRLGESWKHIYAVTDVTEEHNAREKITAAVAAAEQANAAKSRFLANMSHDMRTPMNGIVGMTAIARRSLGDRERVSDCLDKIDLSSRHLLGLINDVLDMSKIESGRLTLDSEPFDLAELLRGLEEMLRPQCEARRQSFTVTVQAGHTRLLGDTVRLRQIFMNLLSNAVKFTPDGGRIEFTAQEQPQRHGDFAAYHFSVRDNGVGISPQFQKSLFTPFERAQDAAVRQTEGTGLGMAITKNLVTAMGGEISVVSALGRGSTFLVELELPLQESGQVEAPAPKAGPRREFDCTGRRFLLAEDNDINREIAVVLLRERGAEVEGVQDGRQAVDRFLAAPEGYYDAVLMDIQMPVMDGYQAARAIRASGHPQAGSIPIVAMTANAFAEDVRAALAAGMNAHIAKPIEPDVLYDTLETCLRED